MRGSRDCGDGMQRGRIATRTFAPPQAGELVSAANLRGCSLRQEAPSVRFAATSPAVAGEDKANLQITTPTHTGKYLGVCPVARWE
jgi:hypothetical protein